MKAGEVKFQDLLNGKIQYRVPLFQRTYSWREEHWQRLWDDILEIYAIPTPRSHFIGAIVTQPMDDAPEFAAKFMLIDGQQRLTTLFILLSAIRDAAASSTDTKNLADELNEDALFNKHVRRDDERAKIRPTQKDRDDLNAVLAGAPASQASLVGQARGFFGDVLSRGDLESQPFDLYKLKSRVADYLDLVSIKLDPGDSAPRIFESLNNTGMALTASDLVRNHIFMSIPNEAEQNAAYDQYWMPMEVRLSTENGGSVLTDFFWRYLMMNGTLPVYDAVFEGIRDRIDARRKDGRTIVEVLAELDEHSRLYARIWKPAEFETIAAVREQQTRLNQWEVDVAYPFIMWAHRLLGAGTITAGQLVAVLEFLESFAVRRFVCGVPTNRMRRIFAQMPTKVDPMDFVMSARSYLTDNDWPTDGLFSERFQTVRVYSVGRLARARLILESLERSHTHKEHVALDEQITIEHIMPQGLSDQWRDELGPDALQTHERYLHSIGNLTFTGYNSELGNMPFDLPPEALPDDQTKPKCKRTIFRKSKLELNTWIAQQTHWGEPEITARAGDLADRALKIWKRDG